MRTFSYGGGVQSTAALVLAAQGRLHYDSFLFCNVGEDSENPATLAYFIEYALPYADEHDIVITELQKTRFGEPYTLYECLVGDNRSIKIPAYLSNGAPGNRCCTTEWKIRVVARWLKQHGATSNEPAVTGLGISMDEFHRARSNSGIPWQVLEYPLLKMRMTRKACIDVIKSVGLPVPPKSSCWFCPYHRPQYWTEMRANNPEMFYRAVALENRINEKRDAIGKDIVHIHPKNKPLEIATGEQFDFFNEMDMCESGYCMM